MVIIKNQIKNIFGLFGIELFRKDQLPFFLESKYKFEVEFWKIHLSRIKDWYQGDLQILYGEKSPNATRITNKWEVTKRSIKQWLNTHQSPKYLDDLLLNKKSFVNMKLLDIGSGPIPSAMIFEGCELTCFDPLLPFYSVLGYPMHIYNDNVRFVFGFSEDMPFPDNSFDAIISVNAIDHVDDFDKTVQEIRRVLVPNGKMRFHIHYHDKTKTEPIELNDDKVQKAFSWDKSFKKIAHKLEKRGNVIQNNQDAYTVWSNFD